jgi:hypothetical protein
MDETEVEPDISKKYPHILFRAMIDQWLINLYILGFIHVNT